MCQKQRYGLTNKRYIEELTFHDIIAETGSGSGEILTATLLPSSVQSLRAPNCSDIICREGFFCESNINECVPQCGVWSQYSHSVNIVIDTLTLVSVCCGALGGVGVLIVAVLRRKKVYVRH